MDIFDCIGTLLRGSWDMITTITWPGTELTIAAILIGVFSAVVSLRIVGYVIGTSYNTAAIGRTERRLISRHSNNTTRQN